MKIDKDFFYKTSRNLKLFTALSQRQVDSINLLLDNAEVYFTDKRHIAYLLATTYHETAYTMLPIKEYGSVEYLKSKKYYPYYGRGYVQITWLDNYRAFSKITGYDLVKDPDICYKPEVAAKIACHGMLHGSFTGKKLVDYFNDKKTDPINARKIINGLDKAAKIAGHYMKFLECLQIV